MTNLKNFGLDKALRRCEEPSKMSSETSGNDKLQLYVEAFEEFKTVLNDFCDALLQSHPEIKSVEVENATSIDRLITHYDILENQLSTLANWITVQKRAFQTIQTLIQWADAIKQNPELFEDVDELLMRMRVMLLPAAEMFIQEIAQAEKASKRLRNTVMNLRNLPNYLNSTQHLNETILEILQFNEEFGTSLLTDSIYNLYQSRLDTFREQLAQLKQNIEKSKPQADTESTAGVENG